jgi:preprotein translocase subunit SecY
MKTRWYQKIIDVWKNRELRRKILFVFFIFAVFRAMAVIPIPGADLDKLQSFFTQSEFMGFFNLLTGGALSNFSIVMLGMGPYITAVIILQLGTMIFPALERLYRDEGEDGRRKFNQYGRILTIPLALVQGYAMIALLRGQEVISTLTPAMTANFLVTVTAGAIVLMWLGEMITERGIGNGVSLMIFAGIIAGVPMAAAQLIADWTIEMIPLLLVFLMAGLAMIALVVLMNEGKRNIPVSYTKRVRGMKMYGGTSTYLPLNVNPAGVLPIIFALAAMSFPQMIAQFWTESSNGVLAAIAAGINWFVQNAWLYGLAYFLLIIGFTYFYTAVTFEPDKISENLQKSGAFVPGIRPGKPTSHHLNYILKRCLFVGAIFLGFVALVPSIIQGITGIGAFQFMIGGTSLLIIVSVIMDTLRQIQAQMKIRDYESF